LPREIADDPHGFMLREGWQELDFEDAVDQEKLQRLLDTLQIEIVSTLDAINELHESADFELYKLSAEQPELLEEVAESRGAVIDAAIEELREESDRLANEIEELTRRSDFP